MGCFEVFAIFPYTCFMRRITFLFTIIILFLFFPNKVLAQEDFLVDAKILYEVSESGYTKTNLDIKIINANDDFYAESYTLNLYNINPENSNIIYRGREIPFKETRDNNDYEYKIAFDDIVIGAGNSRSFSIAFSDTSFAKKTGEVWEITIPRISDLNDFRNYNVTLRVPSSFGLASYVTPIYEKVVQEANYTDYFFSKDGGASGITAGFGQFQVFTFSINYHLENPLNRESSTQIAMPPDTSFQRVYYSKIEPEPDNVVVDADGNWIASYTLGAREKIDVNAFGSVQIFAEPIELPKPPSNSLAQNSLPTEFWESADPEIIKLANDLKTPKKIYEYVSSTLKYDYLRVRPNIQRYGAKGALINKQSAICMEYTDLFIAISRAAGIPAREINGFAYTENPQIQPLSLVADVLHAWPEYWDEERSAWIPVDPTWGATTGGVDYFSNLDLRHFTFVIHGIDPQLPYPPGSYKLGPNPQKDVFVSFGQLPQDKNPELEISSVRKKSLPLTKTKLLVRFKNKGVSSLYDLKPKVLFDDKIESEGTIAALPPGGFYEMLVFVPFSLFGATTPEKVVIETPYQNVSIPTYKNQLIIVNLLTLVLFLISVLLFLFHKTGKLDLFYKKLKVLNVKKKNTVRKDTV